MFLQQSLLVNFQLSYDLRTQLCNVPLDGTVDEGGEYCIIILDHVHVL